jgi:hypothetical protein
MCHPITGKNAQSRVYLIVFTNLKQASKLDNEFNIVLNF